MSAAEVRDAEDRAREAAWSKVPNLTTADMARFIRTGNGWSVLALHRQPDGSYKLGAAVTVSEDIGRQALALMIPRAVAIRQAQWPDIVDFTELVLS